MFFSIRHDIQTCINISLSTNERNGRFMHLCAYTDVGYMFGGIIQTHMQNVFYKCHVSRD